MTEHLDAVSAVFDDVRRVLRRDGTLWLNYGDAYAGSWGAQGRGDKRSEMEIGGRIEGHRRKTLSEQQIIAHPKRSQTGSLKRTAGLKAKDLMGLPWRIAFALQDAGWYLRSDIIWAKPNPMPESCTDRPTRAHEYVFLLTKSARYHYDAEAIKESAVYVGLANQDESGFKNPQSFNGKHKDGYRSSGPKGNAKTFRGGSYVGGEPGPRTTSGNEPNETGLRNARSVWEIATAPFSEAHFATFPPALAERCIKAGCPEYVCSACGKPLDSHIQESVRASTNGHDLSALRDDVQEAAIARVPQQVLQPRVRRGWKTDDQGSGRVPLVRSSNSTGSQEPTAGVLQQSMRFAAHGEDALDDEGALHNDQGLCGDIQAGSSQCVEGRLRDGASPCDGRDDRPPLGANGDRASQERAKDGQCSGEPGSDAQDRARQTAKGPHRNGVLPSLHGRNTAVPSCPSCGADLARLGAFSRGVVLDCFGGAGTVGLVADRLQRNAILIELNPDYAAMAERRIRGDAPMFAEVSP